MMESILPQRFKLRFWLLAIAMVILWATGASAAPVTDPQAVFARPAWAQNSPWVSRQEFSLLIEKIVSLHATAPRGQLPTPTPDAWITRGQAVNDLVKAFGFDEKLATANAKYTFPDVQPGHPFHSAVALARQTSMINGYPDGTFRPDMPLRWEEAVTMLEILQGWTQVLPNQAPGWVTAKLLRTETWYRFFGSLRLGLTLAYGIVAVCYLWRAFRKPIRHPVRRLITHSLLILSILLVAAWSVELGYATGVLKRTFYEAGALLSLVAAFFLLKTGHALSGRTEASPAPRKMNMMSKRMIINCGRVESIDHSKGELYVVDPVSRQRHMVIANPDTKIFAREGRGSSAAFLSQIQAGDVLNVQGTSSQRGALITADSVVLVARGRAEVVQEAPLVRPMQQVRPLYMETQNSQRQARHLIAYR